MLSIELLKETKTDENEKHILDLFLCFVLLIKVLTSGKIWLTAPPPLFFDQSYFLFRRNAYEICPLLSHKGEVFNFCATSSTKKNSNNNEWMKFKMAVTVWTNPESSHSNKHTVWVEIDTSVQSILKGIVHPKIIHPFIQKLFIHSSKNYSSIHLQNTK